MSSFFFQAEDGIRDLTVTGVQTCALPIYHRLHGKQAWGIVVDRRLRLQGGGKHPQERQQVDGGERYQRAVCDESDRSEERRVGKECRARWSPYDSKKKEKLKVNLTIRQIQ